MKLEVGQYYETKDGIRYYCLAKNQFSKNYPMVVTKNKSSVVSTRSEDGKAYVETSCSDDLVRHLPGCTGFDWVELKIPEGWDKISDNEKMKSGDRYLYKDGADQPVYSYVGKTFAELKEKGMVLKDWECIIRRKTPVYTYRPFANEVEFAPNFDRHILRSSIRDPNSKGAYRLDGYDEMGVWSSGRRFTYEEMFQLERKFADTGEPFGAKC